MQMLVGCSEDMLHVSDMHSLVPQVSSVHRISIMQNSLTVLLRAASYKKYHVFLSTYILTLQVVAEWTLRILLN